MKNVLDELDKIMLNTKDTEVAEKLRFVISEIQFADALMKFASDFACDFLSVNYGDEKVKLRLKDVWDNQEYEKMYIGVWTDLKKIKDACCILVGTLSYREREFDRYCEDYLKYFKNYMNTDRPNAGSFNKKEETPERFKDSVRMYIEKLPKEDVPYNNYCHKKILSLVE